MMELATIGVGALLAGFNLRLSLLLQDGLQRLQLGLDGFLRGKYFVELLK